MRKATVTIETTIALSRISSQTVQVPACIFWIAIGLITNTP